MFPLSLITCVRSPLRASAAHWCPHSNSTIDNQQLLLRLSALLVLLRLERTLGRESHCGHLLLGRHRSQLPTSPTRGVTMYTLPWGYCEHLSGARSHTTDFSQVKGGKTWCISLIQSPRSNGIIFFRDCQALLTNRIFFFFTRPVKFLGRRLEPAWTGSCVFQSTSGTTQGTATYHMRNTLTNIVANFATPE